MWLSFSIKLQNLQKKSLRTKKRNFFDPSATQKQKERMSDDEEEQSTFYGVAVPNDLKSLRACKVCTLVMTYDQFYRNGRFSFIFFFFSFIMATSTFFSTNTQAVWTVRICRLQKIGMEFQNTQHHILKELLDWLNPRYVLHFFSFFFSSSIVVDRFPPLFISAEELDC